MVKLHLHEANLFRSTLKDAFRNNKAHNKSGTDHLPNLHNVIFRNGADHPGLVGIP